MQPSPLVTLSNGVGFYLRLLASSWSLPACELGYVLAYPQDGRTLVDNINGPWTAHFSDAHMIRAPGSTKESIQRAARAADYAHTVDDSGHPVAHVVPLRRGRPSVHLTIEGIRLVCSLEPTPIGDEILAALDGLPSEPVETEEEAPDEEIEALPTHVDGGDEPPLAIREGSDFNFLFDGVPVTIIRGENGDPEWIADEVCAVLGIQNSRDTLRKVLDDDEKGVATVYTIARGPQRKATVNEFGLYSLILRSRKPQAKRFKRWITHEVLPAIRRQGWYSTTNEGPVTPALEARIAALEQRLALPAPASDALVLARLDEFQSRVERALSLPVAYNDNSAVIAACEAQIASLRERIDTKSSNLVKIGRLTSEIAQINYEMTTQAAARTDVKVDVLGDRVGTLGTFVIELSEQIKVLARRVDNFSPGVSRADLEGISSGLHSLRLDLATRPKPKKHTPRVRIPPTDEAYAIIHEKISALPFGSKIYPSDMLTWLVGQNYKSKFRCEALDPVIERLIDSQIIDFEREWTNRRGTLCREYVTLLGA